MQPLDLTDNQKRALAALIEHRSLVRSAGGRWSPPGMGTPSFFGTKTVSALMEMGFVVKDKSHPVAEEPSRVQRWTPIILAPHLNLDDPAARALAVEKHIKGIL